MESEVKKKRVSVKEISKWFRGLEENKWRKTYPVDARRIAHFVNLGEDCELPKSLKKKREDASYKREMKYARKYREYIESKQLEEAKLEESVRKLVREMIVEIRQELNEIRLPASKIRKYNKKKPMVLINGQWFMWEDGNGHSVVVSDEDGGDHEVSYNQIDQIDESINIKEAKKSKSAKKVLQLMDKFEDGESRYSEFVKKVAKQDGISVAQLEKELEPFV